MYVPIICPVCGDQEPAVWKYNLQYHLTTAHPTINHAPYVELYTLSPLETTEMKKLWDKGLQVPSKRPKKSKLSALIVSEAHRSQIAR